MIQFLYTNLFDAAAVTSFSAAGSTFLAPNVQDVLLKKVWRSTGLASEWLKFDLGNTAQITTFTFFNNNFSSTAVLKLYGSNSNLGDTEAAWSGAYNQTITTFDNTAGYATLNQSFRYWLFTMTDTSNTSTYVQVGRVYAGIPISPSENFNEVFTETNMDPSDLFQTTGQTQYSVERPHYKTLEITFNEVPIADQNILRALWASVKKITPFVLILDPLVYPTDLTRYGVFTTDLVFQWTQNQKVNCPMSFKELR